MATAKRRPRGKRTPVSPPIDELVARLRRAYPDAKLALRFTSPLELLVALILAAQCTDDKVNEVTEELFRKYRSAADYAGAARADLENDIRATGFYRNKARAVQECCEQLRDRFGGEVPDRFDDLVALRGVGRKTANILLGNAFGVPGIGVDTHVFRLAHRLGLSTAREPDDVEADLTAIVPRRHQIRFCYLLQAHGRRVCVARVPRCPACTLADLCPFPDKTPPPAAKPKPRPAFGGRPAARRRAGR